MDSKPIVIIGGSGKTGRRVAERLAAGGESVRLASRSTIPAFDWTDPTGLGEVLAGVLQALGRAAHDFADHIAVPSATCIWEERR